MKLCNLVCYLDSPAWFASISASIEEDKSQGPAGRVQWARPLSSPTVPLSQARAAWGGWDWPCSLGAFDFIRMNPVSYE